jgi:hypothetical protein
VSDLEFFVEFTVSIAVVVGPIAFILRRLAGDDLAVSDLFTVSISPDVGSRPPEEETPPRWRTELLRPRQRPAEKEPMAASGRSSIDNESAYGRSRVDHS